MKFKKYLHEYKERDKEYNLMADGYLPLSPSILKDFEMFIPEAYHVTSARGYKHILKIEGTRKDISAFTKGSSGLSFGARESTEVLLKLEGYSSFQAEKDIFSTLDRSGIRWLNPKMSGKDLIVNNKFSVPMKKKMIKYLDVNDRFGILGAIGVLSNKEKGQFVKWYFDESKKLITKKLLDEIKISISKKHTSGGYSNNEILLHNFTILDEYLVIDKHSDKEVLTDKFERDGIPVPSKTIQRDDIEKIQV